MLAAQIEASLLACLAATKVLWVAFSGGVDSQVLLQLLAKLPRNATQLKAVHIHHGLSSNADVWQQHCEQVCAALTIPLQVIKVDAHPAKGQSPEAAARQARYQAFRELITTGEVIVTAHHQDDQAETLLLQLFRGAGIKGLAAMPASSSLGAGTLIRPLLASTRAAIVCYAQQQQLQWIEDESNSNHRFERNYLRQVVMPHLQQRWPAITAVLARTASHCAQTIALIDEVSHQDLITVQGSERNILSIQRLLQLSTARLHHVLRYWLEVLLLPLPSTQQLQKLISNVLLSSPTANPKLSWANVNIRRYRDSLYALQQDEAKFSKVAISWDAKAPLTLPNQLGVLHAQLQPGAGIRPDVFTQSLQIKFRQSGERCHPVGRQGSHPLKKLFQEWGVPPWQRDTIPLLYAEDQLVAVIGYCVCQLFAVNKNASGWVVSLAK